MKEVESRKLGDSSSVLSGVRACAAEWSELCRTQSSALQAYVAESTKKLDASEDKWNAAHDRIDRALKHIATDMEAVQAEEVRPATHHHLLHHHITAQQHIASHHITSHHITSHHITSHHILAQHSTPHHTQHIAFALTCVGWVVVVAGRN